MKRFLAVLLSLLLTMMPTAMAVDSSLKETNQDHLTQPEAPGGLRYSDGARTGRMAVNGGGRKPVPGRDHAASGGTGTMETTQDTGMEEGIPGLTASRVLSYDNQEIQIFTAEEVAAAARPRTLGAVRILSCFTDDSGESIVDPDSVSSENTAFRFQLRALDPEDNPRSTTIQVFFESENYGECILVLVVTVTAKNVVSSQIAFPDGAAEYTGQAQRYEKAVYGGEQAGDPRWTYTYSPEDVTDAGWYTVTAVYEDEENYGAAQAVFAITPRSLADADVVLGEALTYNGEAQCQTVASVTVGGAALTAARDYEVTQNTGTGAGSYAMTITGRGNYAGTATKEFTIAPRAVTVAAVSARPRPYEKDNVTVAIEAVAFDGGIEGEEITYTAAGTMADANAGEGKPVAVAVALTDPNYILSGDIPEAEVTITKAAAETNRTAAVAHREGESGQRTYDLSQVLPDGGATAYACDAGGGVSDPHGILAAGSCGFDDAARALTYELSGEGTSGDSASIRFVVNSLNYQPVMMTLTISLTERARQDGLVFTSGNTVTYGQSLTLSVSGGSGSGAVSYAVTGGTGGATVSGSVLTATRAGTVTVTAVKDGDDTYARAAATQEIIIQKAVPTGAPAYTAITTGGRTLADAGITTSGGAFSVPGTVAWRLADTTEVMASTAYEWVFTPEDAVNYHQLSGSVILWAETAPEPEPETPPAPTPETPPAPGPETPPTSRPETSPAPGTAPGAPGGTAAGGAQTVVQPSAAVQGSMASAAVSESTGGEIVAQAQRGGSDTVVVAPEMPAGVTNASVTIPCSTVGELAAMTDADMRVDTPVASVTLPNESLSGLGGAGGRVTVSVRREDGVVSVEISVDGRQVEDVAGGLKVQVPCEDSTPGTVAVVLRPDGTREVLRTSVAADGVLTAALEGSASIAIVDNSKTFTDVPTAEWYSGAVNFASSHELMNGTDSGVFSPGKQTTRGTIAVILYHVEHDPGAAGAPFSDVEAGNWYTDAVGWAAESGLVSGYGTGRFGPDDVITREQMALILYNYAAWKGLDVSAGGNIGSFADGDKVSIWADDAMSWAVAAGLLTGKDGGRLDPQGTASRAEAAAMLMRFCQILAR